MGVLSNWVVFWGCWGRMGGRVVIDDCRFTIYYLGLWWGGTRQRIGAGFRFAQEGNVELRNVECRREDGGRAWFI